MLSFGRAYIARANYSLYQQRRFGDRITEQERIANALANSHADELLAISKRMYQCCQNAMVAVDDATGDVCLHEKRCKSRQCVYCGRLRVNACLAKLLKAVSTMNSPRFLTLTVASSDDPLREQLQHLRDSFARLRRQRGWKTHVCGGIYTIEVTRNPTTKQWHPHIHAIIDGTFWKQPDIANAWLIATGNSSIVDIRFVHNRESQTRYLATYATKSSDMKSIPTPHIAEFVEQTRSLRLFQTFGTLHGVNLKEEDDDESRNWVQIVPTEELTTAAAAGDGIADHLLKWLMCGGGNKLPDGLRGAIDPTQTGIETASSLIRHWWNKRQEIHRDEYFASKDSTRKRGANDRTERFWQESEYQRVD